MYAHPCVTPSGLPALVTILAFHFLCTAGLHSLADSQTVVKPHPPMSKSVSFLVRYTALQPDPKGKYFETTGWPELQASMCHVERNLAPELLSSRAFGALPYYVIYTDNQTDLLLAERLEEAMPKQASRVKLVNLDLDAEDGRRMAPFRELELDSKNLCSVRRTLADTAHLPASAGRLLLGADVTFTTPPGAFVRRAASLRKGTALYMAEMCWRKGELYTVANYTGPQCAGLLGDFIYLAPGVDVTRENLQGKMMWYAGQSHAGQRLVPAHPIDGNPKLGLH